MQTPASESCYVMLHVYQHHAGCTKRLRSFSLCCSLRWAGPADSEGRHIGPLISRWGIGKWLPSGLQWPTMTHFQHGWQVETHLVRFIVGI